MYVGQPADPTAFDAYYWKHHLPTVEKWPGIRRITIAKGGAGDEIYQVADLWFDSRAALDAALASPERKASAEDVKAMASLIRSNERLAMSLASASDVRKEIEAVYRAGIDVGYFPALPSSDTIYGKAIP